MAVMQKEEEKTTQIILEVLKNSIFNVTWAIFPIDVCLFFCVRFVFLDSCVGSFSLYPICNPITLFVTPP